MLPKIPVFNFVKDGGKRSSDIKEMLFILVNLTPVSKEELEPLGIGELTIVRIMSKLRNEGQDIRFDKELGYYVGEKRPYRMHVLVERVDGDKSYGKLFGSFPCVVISNRPLRVGVNLIRGIIEGFDGERLIVRRVGKI